MAAHHIERRAEPREPVDQSYSVEFSISGRNITDQYRVWNKGLTSMSFLVQESSDILPCLKVGHTVRMKYYHADLLCPSESLKTVIRHVTKKDQGRLKGHYLVGLEISEKRELSEVRQDSHLSR